MDTIPLPNQLYELKIFFWIVSIIILVLGAVSLWFLVRMVMNQDEMNKEIKLLVEHNSGDLDILKSDLFEMTKLLNSDLRVIKKEVDSFENSLVGLQSKTDQSFAYLVQINKEVAIMKENLERHESVLYGMKSTFQGCKFCPNRQS
jgi:hypothetical protein